MGRNYTKKKAQAAEPNPDKQQKEEESAAIIAKKRHLVEMIEKYPILYDLSHADYKNNAMKNVVWMEMASILKEDGKYICSYL